MKKYVQSSFDLPCFSGESKMHGISGDPVNRGRVNAGLIVNPNFGEHSHAWYIERDTVNRGPVNRGMTVYIISMHKTLIYNQIDKIVRKT